MAGYRTFEATRVVVPHKAPRVSVVDITLVRPRLAERPAWKSPVVKALPTEAEVKAEKAEAAKVALTAAQRQDRQAGRLMPRLMNIVVAATQVSRADILSHRRDADAVKARHILFWLARTTTPLSYPQMARRVGRRDHTTAMNGVRRVQDAIDRDGLVVSDNEAEMACRLWEAYRDGRW